MEQGYIALSATQGRISISLRGKIKNIHEEKLNEIFETNPYMQSIYSGETRAALEVFCLYAAQGEYFDIIEPSHVTRDSFSIGDVQTHQNGYFVGNELFHTLPNKICKNHGFLFRHLDAHLQRNFFALQEECHVVFPAFSTGNASGKWLVSNPENIRVHSVFV